MLPALGQREHGDALFPQLDGCAQTGAARADDQNRRGEDAWLSHVPACR
jgi:hypothetical protein